MLFTEARFLLFFAVVFAIHWALRSNEWRKNLLLVASYAFYAAWDWRFSFLIAASTLIDYVAAGRMPGARSVGSRRALLMFSLVGNLGALALFKYYDFFVTSGASLLSWFGLDVEPRTLSLILPVGISFYTFQSLSYTIDVYRDNLRPIQSLRDFALFVSFFPQLVAGPIVRARDFLPQLERARAFPAAEVRALLVLFLIGYVKKACVSDQVAPVIDAAFRDPAAFSSGDLWLAAALYTVRIYCDFSGYSDMAIAAAGLLGYRLPLNFDFPYLASSITDFWRRWHISLSSWFRDYLYVPLGGNRGGRARTYRNLFLVFLLCGLWHGAAWTFVLWGLFHGAFLILERLFGIRDGSGGGGFVVAACRRAYVVGVALVGWILFRAESLSGLAAYLGGLATPGRDASVDPAWWLVAAGFAAVHPVMNRLPVARLFDRLPGWCFSVVYGAAAAAVMPFAAPDYEAFIYFQF